MVRPAAWPAKTGAGHTDAFQQGLRTDGVVALASGEEDGQGSAEAVAGEVDFAGQASSGSAEGVIVRFVLPVVPPFRPVVAACWWARTMVESIWTSQSISPAASAWAWICWRA